MSGRVRRECPTAVPPSTGREAARQPGISRKIYYKWERRASQSKHTGYHQSADEYTPLTKPYAHG